MPDLPTPPPIPLTPEENDRFKNLLLENDKRVHNILMAFVSKYVSNKSNVDDIFQEILLHGMLKFRQHDPSRSFLAWMLRIAANKIARIGHNQGREKEILQEFMEAKRGLVAEFLDLHTPDDKTLDSEKRRIAGEILDSLPKDLQQYFIFHELLGFELKDLGDHFGVSESTAYRRVAEARAILEARGKTYSFLLWTTVFSEEHLAAASTAGTGSVGGTSGLALTGTLLALSLPFLWVVSLLIGGQYYGTTLVRNAPSLQARRWLTRRLFIAYCGIVAVPLYFYFGGRLLALHVLDRSIWQSGTHVTNMVILVVAVVFVLRTRKAYRRLLNSGDSLEDRAISYSGFRRLILAGFAVLTICLALLFVSWYYVILAPGLDYSQAYAASRLKHTLIYSTALVGSLLACFHVSSFFLFWYFLAISRDDTSLARVPLPIDAFEIGLKTDRSLWRFLCVSALLFGIASNILHLLFVRTRVVFAIVELTAICLLWGGTLTRFPDDPKKRLGAVVTACAIQAVVMYLLRVAIYD